LLHHGNWIALFTNLRALIEVLLKTIYIWMPVFEIFQLTKYAHQFSNELELAAFRALVRDMRAYVDIVFSEYESLGESPSDRIDLVAVKSAASSALKEIGDSALAVEWAASSLTHM
jgi:hypothetical protein